MKSEESRKDVEGSQEKSLLKSWLGFVPLIVCLILVFLIQSFSSDEQQVHLDGESRPNANLKQPMSDQELEKLARKNSDLVNEQKKQKERTGNSSAAKKQSPQEAQGSKPQTGESSRNSSIRENLSGSGSQGSSGLSDQSSSDQNLPSESQKLTSALPVGSFGNEGVGLDNSVGSAAAQAGPSDLAAPQIEKVIHFDQNYAEPVEIKLEQQGSIVTENGSSVHRLSEALKLGESEASFNLERIGFESGSANLLGGSDIQIRNLASVLKNYPDYQLEIISPVSSDQKTAKQRAEQLRGKLMSEGVESSRLTSGTSREPSSEGQISLHLSRR